MTVRQTDDDEVRRGRETASQPEQGPDDQRPRLSPHAEFPREKGESEEAYSARMAHIAAERLDAKKRQEQEREEDPLARVRRVFGGEPG